MIRRRPILATALLVALVCGLQRVPQAQEAAVPTDLKPLLAAPQSEMRMVVQRYSLDRTTLSGNYANGSSGAADAVGGEGAAPMRR